jgi:hypothetical protein
VRLLVEPDAKTYANTNNGIDPAYPVIKLLKFVGIIRSKKEVVG